MRLAAPRGGLRKRAVSCWLVGLPTGWTLVGLCQLDGGDGGKLPLPVDSFLTALSLYTRPLPRRPVEERARAVAEVEGKMPPSVS